MKLKKKPNPDKIASYAPANMYRVVGDDSNVSRGEDSPDQGDHAEGWDLVWGGGTVEIPLYFSPGLV